MKYLFILLGVIIIVAIIRLITMEIKMSKVDDTMKSLHEDWSNMKNMYETIHDTTIKNTLDLKHLKNNVKEINKKINHVDTKAEKPKVKAKPKTVKKTIKKTPDK